jgi:hypothetical protein
VIDADLLARVGDSGSTLGTLRARLLDDPAAFVAIHATTDLESLAALVDAAPVRPLRAGDGRLLIPLPIRSTPTAGAPRPALVELAWRFKPPAGAGAGATRVLDLPSAGSGVPHRVEIHTTDDRGATGRVALDGFEPASAFDLEWGRAFAMRRGLSDRLERLDRSRPADRTALLEGLIRFLIQLRAAERALDQGDPASNEPPRSAGLDRIRALREDFDAELSASGLDDLAQSARSRVGLEVADPLPALDPRIAGPMSFPIRTVGAARRFQGVGPDRTIPMSLAPPKRTGPRVPDIDLKPAASLAAALGLVALLGLSTRSRALAALAACLVAIGLAWVFPALLASVVATLALGALVEATRDRLADA